MFDRIETSLKSGLPFSVYRKPKESTLTGVFQKDDNLHHTTDFKEKGFVFAPFSSENGAVLIQPDELLKVDFPASGRIGTSTVSVSESGKEDHLDLVEKGIQEIKQGNLKKVVLSRKIEVGATKSPLEVFDNLLNSYPNAFCYLFHHPKVGTWCGATPETLVKIKNGTLQTMSLAATLPFVEDEEPNWGNKEVEEQKMVSDYIQDKLGALVENLEIGEAKSVRAGNLWHLRSKVKGNILSSVGLSKIIDALHPTPAVCGIPTKDAKEFILQNENYQRTFYTGFLGEVNLQNDGETTLFVNLRCMELKSGSASIFVGGGITEASVPESEWLETQNKSRTMLNIL